MPGVGSAGLAGGRRERNESPHTADLAGAQDLSAYKVCCLKQVATQRIGAVFRAVSPFYPVATLLLISYVPAVTIRF
jgi:hypothetical protein